MLFVILLGAAALIPSVLLVTYFHRRDVYPEPPAVLWRTFGLGIVIIFPVCLVAWPLDSLAEQLGHPLAYGFASAFLGAAIPEELFKFAVVFYFAARHIHFDEPMDGIVYGATASLGFATLENVLYVSDGGFNVALVRAFLSVPGHAFLGVIMGYYIGRAKFTDGDRGPLLARALGIPILLHGLYNTPLLAAGRIDDPDVSATGCLVLLLLPVSPAIVVGEAIWAMRLVRRLRAEQLANTRPPVTDVVVPPPPEFAAPVPPPPPELGIGGALAPKAGERRPGKVIGWLMTLVGGLFVCGGALMTLGMVLALMDPSSEDRLFIALAGLVFGLLPLVLGALAFWGGIRRLNRSG